MSDQALTPPVRAIVDSLLAGAKGALGERFVGLYLHGSLAAGDFDPATSDIDFLVVTRGRLPVGTIAALGVLHARLLREGGPWARRLEGGYMPRAALRRHNADSPHFPHVHGEGYYLAGDDGDWVIRRRVLREHGRAIEGPPARRLIDALSPDELRAATRAVLAEWWAPMLDDRSRLQGEGGPEYQAFTVLTMCRVLYTFAEGDVASKPAAAAWARDAIGARWTPLIDSALAWRTGESFEALDEVLELIRVALAAGGVPSQRAVQSRRSDSGQ